MKGSEKLCAVGFENVRPKPPFVLNSLQTLNPLFAHAFVVLLVSYPLAKAPFVRPVVNG